MSKEYGLLSTGNVSETSTLVPGFKFNQRVHAVRLLSCTIIRYTRYWNAMRLPVLERENILACLALGAPCAIQL